MDHTEKYWAKKYNCIRFFELFPELLFCTLAGTVPGHHRAYALLPEGRVDAL